MRRALAIALLLVVACRPHERAPSPFRFSPRPNRAAEIHWRAWDAHLFADAARTHKPILLSLSAIWCHWCHVLDETTLSDRRVIERLNRDFLPVRVDADQHPDIERRYLLGGWPTVAVLTPGGEIIDGGTYVAPDAFVRLLDDSLAALRAGGGTLEARLGAHRERFDEVQPGPLDAGIVENVTRMLIGAFDSANGGFGQAPKFPQPDAVELLLEVGETDLARRTLDAMLRLEDPVEGGFYRYATRADWTAPHYEKMLVGNAELVAAYAHGFAATHDPRYRAAALRAVAYLRRTLFDDKTGALWSSQDADEAYSALTDRAGHKPPYVDRTLLADRAARAIVALHAAADRLGDPAPADLARRALPALKPLVHPDGTVDHAAGIPGTLADYATLALAFHAAGDDATATRILGACDRRLASPGPAHYDIATVGEGLLRNRHRPFEDNTLLALAHLRLGHADTARAILQQYAAAYLRYGAQAAAYARAVDASGR